MSFVSECIQFVLILGRIATMARDDQLQGDLLRGYVLETHTVEAPNQEDHSHSSTLEVAVKVPSRAEMTFKNQQVLRTSCRRFWDLFRYPCLQIWVIMYLLKKD